MIEAENGLQYYEVRSFIETIMGAYSKSEKIEHFVSYFFNEGVLAKTKQIVRDFGTQSFNTIVKYMKEH